ncbi:MULTISPECIES: hypothetical protein [unclassified Wolbachia]|nr:MULTISPECIES: hypothetical protein [unclassified Wolbachia]
MQFYRKKSVCVDQILQTKIKLAQLKDIEKYNHDNADEAKSEK